jgi:hypothetical protein
MVANNFTVEKILSNILYFRCVDHVQLTSIMNNLKDVIEKQQKVRFFIIKHFYVDNSFFFNSIYVKIKLIIVDSLAYPFRFVDFKDSNSITMKTSVLNNFMLNAYEFTSKYNLSVSKV